MVFFSLFLFPLTPQGLPRGAWWDGLTIGAIQKSLHYSDSISCIHDFHSASRKEFVEQSSAVLQSMIFFWNHTLFIPKSASAFAGDEYTGSVEPLAFFPSHILGDIVLSL